MKKSKKSNVKGFVLVETLITTVFVATILSVIFVNFYPLIGEYERREKYDDVDSKYGAFWVKKMIQDSPGYTKKVTTYSGVGTPFSVLKYNVVHCYDLYSEGTEKNKLCNDMFDKLEIKKVFITAYDIKGLKYNLSHYKTDGSIADMNYSSNFDSEVLDYIYYLPDYHNFQSEHNAELRIIVEFEHNNAKTGTGKDDKSYKTFATMEVN